MEKRTRNHIVRSLRHLWAYGFDAGRNAVKFKEAATSEELKQELDKITKYLESKIL